MILFGAIIKRIMEILELTQSDLALRSGIGQGRISKYLRDQESPSIENLFKILSLIDYNEKKFLKDVMAEVEKTEKKINELKRSITIHKNANKGNVIGKIGTINGDVVNGNVYKNTIVKEINPYSPTSEDITEEQAFALKAIIDEIVKLEQVAKNKPHGYAAVWNKFKRTFRVNTYRAIKKNNYDEAEAYLNKWRGRLKNTKSFMNSDIDEYRKDRYKAIHTAALKNLMWTKEDLNNYILDKYGVNSMKDLDKDNLERLYQKIMALKGTSKA